MKLFQEKTEVCQYQSAEEFVREFQIGEGDFILAGNRCLKHIFKRKIIRRGGTF